MKNLQCKWKKQEFITVIKGFECPNCPFAHTNEIGVIHNTFYIIGSEMEQRLFINQ